MIMKYKAILFITSSIIVGSVQAGVVIKGTRYIYNENQSSIPVYLSNKSDISYLIQSSVNTAQGNELSGTVIPPVMNASPFIITPPLFSLAPGKENVLRIMQVENHLPEDRESLFSLTVAAIPENQGTKKNSVQFAVRNQLKLFYRPISLNEDTRRLYQQLQWRRAGGQVQVENKSAYFITLYQLKINGKKVPRAGMVAPFSQRLQNWCPLSGNCQIEWQTINDAGAVMPVLKVTL